MAYTSTKAHTYYGPDGGLSLLDCVNLAQCASQRALLAAGQGDDRFTREYRSALAWSVAASSYDLTFYFGTR
ncbi:MAG: hypothetical protein ACO253_08025 [Burkholderiaceae bacterium]